MEITYEEFEPFCKWKREPNSDTLEIHLPEFKRQQLRVQLSSSGNLVISGERESDSDGKKGNRFRREFKVSNEIEANQIRAQFCSGILYVIMPKRSTAAAAGVDVKASTMNWNKRPPKKKAQAPSPTWKTKILKTKSQSPNQTDEEAQLEGLSISASLAYN
ncbi:hypothetical protein ERO13_D13G167700v2 [Gossypium hirsutum]|nr:hypothetical protein ERO13_D13G167700v2 [Gossypium hirsutum]